MKTEQVQLHGDSHYDCDTLPQNQRLFGYWQLLKSSAKIADCLDIAENTQR